MYPEGQRVLIEFEHFDVEQSPSCYYDWLEVRDGPSADSNILDTNLCGNTLPTPIASTGNSLTLVFHTDSSVTGSGFKINIKLGKHCL